MALGWGIVSAGKISHDFVTAVGTLPSADHQVVAVAARDLSKAKEFGNLHNIKTAYQGYEPLAKDPNVDIVYVGNLNPQHYEVARLMLENGKHVLCEKPLCMNYRESKELIDFAREKKLFLMEAVWSRFFPAYLELRDYIKSGALGEIFQVNVDFGQPISEKERFAAKSLGGGSLLVLGVYVLQFAQMIYDCAPSATVALGHLNEEGVDLSMSCVLTYPQGGTATLTTQSKVMLSNEATVVGTKGTATMPLFWCPEKLQLADGSWMSFPLPPAAHKFNFANSCGLRYEAEECRQCIKKGLTESPTMSLEESLLIMKIKDDIRKQIGVHFPQDD